MGGRERRAGVEGPKVLWQQQQGLVWVRKAIAAACTVKVKVKEIELEVLLGTVLDSDICNLHSKCCGR